MRNGPSTQMLAGAVQWVPTMSAWLDGALLAESVPVHRGRLSADGSSQVPERLSFSVPRWADRRDWLPGDDATHPLARFGQYVIPTIVITSPITGIQYETVLGRFKVQSWKHDTDNGLIQVEAVGRLQLAADDRLPSPLAPTGTFASEFRRLLPPGLSAAISPALVDRQCPRSMEWSDDRIGALYEIADAWPARIRTDQWGQIAVLPALADTPTPVVSLTDGEGGTVIGTARADTRDQAYNRIVVRASGTDTSDKPPIQAVVDQTSGPMRTAGPYGVVTKYWSSPLITTEGQAREAGVTMLANSLRPSRTVPVTLAPDPRLDLDDAVEIISDGVRDWGYITAYDLPLTIDDGDMRVDVGVSS